MRPLGGLSFELSERFLYLYFTMRAKQRGLRRKIDAMARRIFQLSVVRPDIAKRLDYLDIHIPVVRALVGSKSTPARVRRLFMQMVIDRTSHFISLAQGRGPSERVVAAITLPDLWNAQIIVFFNEKYFESFINNSERTKLDAKRSLWREWNLRLPSAFSEKGFLEEINEPDFRFRGEVWLFGQLAPECSRELISNRRGKPRS